MAVNKVVYGQTTLIDLTADTVTPQVLLAGYTAHDKSGALITGTASGGGSVVITETPDVHGGTIKTITTDGSIDLSQDTVDAAHLLSGYTAHDSAGQAVTGTATSGVDLPTFIALPQSMSATCDKTYVECSDLIVDDGVTAAYVEVYVGSDRVTAGPLQAYSWDSNGITYVLFEGGRPSASLLYHPNGNIELLNDTPSVGTLTATSNTTYTGSLWNEVVVSVSPTLQAKSVTPTELQQTVTADLGYDGLSSVTVGDISSTYVGSDIIRRSSTDLTASGATVTVPSGYYASQATKSVTSGTAGTPTATKGTVSNHAVSVTPSVTNTTGYITGSTKTGTAVTVSASELVSGSETKTANGTYDVTNLASLVVDIDFVTYYTSSSAPTSSQGSDGDIWLVV